jgi:hypothetical protein
MQEFTFTFRIIYVEVITLKKFCEAMNMEVEIIEGKKAKGGNYSIQFYDCSYDKSEKNGFKRPCEKKDHPKCGKANWGA